MAVPSVLFDHIDSDDRTERRDPPEYFVDLNLDQVVAAIAKDRDEYQLQPFFHARLERVEAIAYRHEVLRDLQNEALLGCVRAFAKDMHGMREQLSLADKLRYRRQKQRWFLDAMSTYTGAVTRLTQDLGAGAIASRGLTRFRDHLMRYVSSDAFRALMDDTGRVADALAAIRYSLHIYGDRIRVSRYESEADYSAEVQATFEKFRQGEVRDYRARFSTFTEMNHVEAAVLDMVARLFPEEFSALDDYCARHADFLDPAVAAFDREVQFYVAYIEYMAGFTSAGLRFCYPELSDHSIQIFAHDAFDLALAGKLVPEHAPVVRNDFQLRDPERIFVVSGPNQGGKTTFARTFGQLHHLASLGLPVPGSDARLLLFDELFTHFEKEEDVANLRGKLEDDLVRIHDIVSRATAKSVIIMNEIFTSTTLHDAVFLGQKVMGRIIELGALGVCVTFVDELSRLGPATVSMVSTVAPDDPAVRTYKIVRRPADGLSYAETIAEKYGLSYERLRGRIAA